MKDESYTIDITRKIDLQIYETVDNFIFTNVSPYLNEIYKTVIPKDLLFDAICEYRRNHPDEWEYRTKEALKKVNEEE